MVLKDHDRNPITQKYSADVSAGKTAGSVPKTLFESKHTEFSLGDDVLERFQSGEKVWPSPKPDKAYACRVNYGRSVGTACPICASVCA